MNSFQSPTKILYFLLKITGKIEIQLKTKPQNYFTISYVL